MLNNVQVCVKRKHIYNVFSCEVSWCIDAFLVLFTSHDVVDSIMYNPVHIRNHLYNHVIVNINMIFVNAVVI